MGYETAILHSDIGSILIAFGDSINVNIFLLRKIGYPPKLLLYGRNSGNAWSFINNLQFIIIEKIRFLAVYNNKIGSLGIYLVGKINIKTFPKRDIRNYCSNSYNNAQGSQARAKFCAPDAPKRDPDRLLYL